MNIPRDVVLSFKENASEKGIEKPTEQEKKSNIMNKKNISIFDAIISSYSELEHKINDYKDDIKILRLDADQLKEKISIKRKAQKESSKISSDLTDIQAFDKRIETNNHLINEETCNNVVEHVNHIRSNISTNSKVASHSLKPLEASVSLLKDQVNYTVLLEDILELFKKKNVLKEKMKGIDKIIKTLAESLDITKQ